MQNLLDDLKELLKQDDRLMVEDSLLKNTIIELALKLDRDLIKLLLSHPRLRQHFFVDVRRIGNPTYVVFDKAKFIQFVSNKAFLPDSYTAFSNKIGLTDDGGTTYLSRHRDVVLTWPYKDCVLEGGQTTEDAKRDEVFWNITLSPDDIDRLLDPKVLTNFRRTDADGEHPVTEIADTDNLIIKGNNLLALHSLLPRFRGRVKLIYIDPPYNTGNDSFGYNDCFNHSTWLTFMRNRLEVARDLLEDDGAIYAQIDFNEVHYLKVLMDEVFGRDNFEREIIWRIGWVSGYKTLADNWIRNHDTILFYKKKNLFFNKGYIPYPEGYTRRDGSLPTAEGYPYEDTWNCSDIDRLDSIQIKSFDTEKTGFLTQKNEALLQRIIQAATRPDEIVLDFCAGSGTTAAVAHKMGRQYILVEQMWNQVQIILERMKDAVSGDQVGISRAVGWQGGGDFVYCELMQWNTHYIDQIQAAQSGAEVQALWEEMLEQAFLSYKVDYDQFDEHAEEFAGLSLADQKRFLLEVLDKNQLYVNLSEIDDADYQVSEEDKRLNRQFYGKSE